MKTNQVLNFMKVISWITFIGVCISSGTLIYTFIVSFINPEGIIDRVNGLDFYALKQLGSKQLVYVTSFILVVSLLKAYLFYLVITIFMKINLEQPFNSIMSLLLSKISYFAFSIGLVSYLGTSYISKISQAHPSIHDFLNPVSGFQEFIFFAGIIFIISLVFQKGIEIQSENELTI